jgi:ABC-2 type transport system permease protein
MNREAEQPLAPTTGLRAFWRKVRALLSVYYADVLTYRAEIFLWVISGALPLIMAGLWAELSAQNPEAFSMAPHEYPRYFFCTFVVRQLTLVWVVWEFERDVVEGTLSNYLLQPLDPGWRHFAEHVAERVARLPVLLILGGPFFLLFPESAWLPGAGAIGLALAAMTCTFLMRFTVQYAFAMLSFWTERAHSVERLWYLPYLFLSGLIAPVSEFPEAMQSVVRWTPFPYLIDFPARLLMGREADLMHGFLVTLGWTVVFFGIHRLLWRFGLKHYSAMGA